MNRYKKSFDCAPLRAAPLRTTKGPTLPARGRRTLCWSGQTYLQGSIEMDSEYVPSKSIVLKLDGGEIALGFTARAWDEFGHSLIVVKLPGRTPLYGEWTDRYAENGNDFDVEILGFGYRDGYVVGSPNLADRLIFSPDERTLVEALIRSLFSDPIARSTAMPFSNRIPPRYLGNVLFAPGWIRAQ